MDNQSTLKTAIAKSRLKELRMSASRCCTTHSVQFLAPTLSCGMPFSVCQIQLLPF